MVILITGSSCTGKTLLAQKLLEKYKCPYLSMDHLKMGLIRAGYTVLSPESDDCELTACLWPVVREIIKTNIENGQNLIIEGCYIPFDYKEAFEERYLMELKYVCLIFGGKYIEKNFDDIIRYAEVMENRGKGELPDRERLMRENRRNLELCKQHGCDYILIEGEYCVELDVQFDCWRRGN